MLALPVFSFFVSPLMAQFSRRHEFEADAYACAQASGADLASALLKLHEDNAATLTPDPVYVRFYYSHPPASRTPGCAACGPPDAPDCSRRCTHPLPRRWRRRPRDERRRSARPTWRRCRLALRRRRDREEFGFADFHGTMAFVNALAWIAARRGPPPRPAARLRPLHGALATRIRWAASRSTTSSARPRWTRWSTTLGLSCTPSCDEPGLVVARTAATSWSRRPRAQRVLCHPRGKKSDWWSATRCAGSPPATKA